MGEFERAKWPRQIMGAAIWGVLVGWLGYLFHHSWLPHFVITVWPDFGVFAVSGIWFGAWGILAAYIGNTISSMSAFWVHFVYSSIFRHRVYSVNSCMGF